MASTTDGTFPFPEAAMLMRGNDKKLKYDTTWKIRRTQEKTWNACTKTKCIYKNCSSTEAKITTSGKRKDAYDTLLTKSSKGLEHRFPNHPKIGHED